MNTAPEISVLIPVYNAASFLEEALNSILRQTFQSFEVILIDDGSTDSSMRIADRLRARDGRIRIIREEHKGIVASLNLGISSAKGKYIARMDADDISLRARLKRQHAYLENHPDIGVCGCQLKTTGEGRTHRFRYERNHEAIVCTLLFEPAMPHAASMFRKDILLTGAEAYRTDYPHTEDYDLWIRLADKTRFATLPSVLYLYRQHSAQVTRTEKNSQRELRLLLLRRLGLDPTTSEMELHESISAWTFDHDLRALDGIHAWLLHLHEANEQAQVYPQAAFLSMLALRWKTILHYFIAYGKIVSRTYHDSVLQRHASWSRLDEMKFRLKSLIPYSR